MIRLFFVLILIVSFQISLYSEEIYSWTAPDGQLYMVSSQKKLSEIKSKYDIPIEKKNTNNTENKDINTKIDNKQKKNTLNQTPSVETRSTKKTDNNRKSSGINIYIVTIIISSFAGAFMGFAYNNKRNTPKKDQKNENIEILAVIDRKLL